MLRRFLVLLFCVVLIFGVAHAEEVTPQFSSREDAQAYVDSVIAALNALSQAEEAEAKLARQKRLSMSSNDVFPAPYATTATDTKVISKSNGSQSYMGYSFNLVTYANVQYYYGEGISRFQDCLNAWSDVHAITVGGTVTGETRDYIDDIIDSGRTLAVTTYNYVTVTVDMGVMPSVSGSTTVTQYTEFGYNEL